MFSPLTDTMGFGWFTDEQVDDNLKLFTILGIEGTTGSCGTGRSSKRCTRTGPPRERRAC